MGSESYPYLDDAELMNIRANHRQSLGLLVTQASTFGIQVPIMIANQIKETVAEIDAINTELARRGIATSDPPPGSAIQTVIRHYYGTTIIGNQGVASGGNADDSAQISSVDGATQVRDNGRATDAKGAQSDTEHSDQAQQDFSRSEVSMSGGDYAGKDVHKPLASAAAPATLRTLIERAQAAASAAQTDDEELADQLHSVAIQLRDARRKLVEAQKSLRALGAAHPIGAQLAQDIGALVEQQQ